MVDYSKIVPYFFIIILTSFFGYALASHYDPVIGAWSYDGITIQGGTKANIQFNSDGTYLHNVEYCQIMKISNKSTISCRGLAPIQGHWTKEWDGKYHLTRNEVVQVWNYSSLSNCIYNEENKNQMYCR